MFGIEFKHNYYFWKKITIKLFNLKTMNYSTLKKTVALSLVSLLAVGIANAQTDTSKAAKPMATSDTATTAKVFGGRAQYNTWSVGVNVGLTAPSVATGGVTVFDHNQPSLGYGISVRDQLAHSFGLQIDLHGGTVKGNAGSTTVHDITDGIDAGSFSTQFMSASISGVVNVATIDYIRRKNAVNFFIVCRCCFSIGMLQRVFRQCPKYLGLRL